MLIAQLLLASRVALNCHSLFFIVLAATYAPLSFSIGIASADTTAPPITLTADQAILRLEGEQLFKGNVVLTQGTIKFNADEILIKRRNGAISYIGATGSPLLFESSSITSETTTIEAQKLEYKTASWKIVLLDTIRMAKSGMSMHAERVEYHIRNAKYVLFGNSQESVKIRIYPAGYKK